MATYASQPILSKVKIGDTTYYLKDADARAVIDTIFGDYLKSSDKTQLQGYITALETKVGADTDEAAAAGSLYARIKKEVADRAAAITSVNAAIESEASARQDADAALSTRIDAIVSAAIANNEKVLSLENNKLKSTLSLAIEKQNNVDYIVLKGINGAEVAKVDASAFVADGMVNSVELIKKTVSDVEHTYIKITFNTIAGKNPIELDVTSLIDIYTAGNGLTVANNVFSIDLDETGESFLTVGANGLKLSGVQDAIDAGRDAAKTYADGIVGAEETRAKAAEGALGTRIAAFEASGAHDVAALETRVGTAETKLSGIAAGAQVNVIEKVKLNGVDLTVDSEKRVDLGTIATSSELTALAGRVSTAEGKLNTIQGDVNTAGSIAKGDADTLDAAKDYVDAKVIEEAGAHTHSVTASGSITPNLTPTDKYLTASASGVAVNPTSENKFITAVNPSSQGLQVASYVNSVGKVAKTVKNWSIAPDGTDTECLVFSPVDVSWDGVGTIGTANAATGELGNGSGLAQVVTGFAAPTTAAAVTSVTVSAQPTVTLSASGTSSTGAIKYLEEVVGASTSVSVEGTTESAGAHTHDIENGSSGN